MITRKWWQASAYVDGRLVADWGRVDSLIMASYMASNLRAEFPHAIVAIMPARY